LPAGDRAAAAAVVEQCADGLLQHPLLAADDDPGAEVDQSLEAVASGDPAVRPFRSSWEPATVELHHRAQVRWDD
jgi:hypothetical protein